MVKRKTRADSNSGAERLEGSTPSTPTCACGKQVKIKKTGECSACYHRRYYHEKRRKPIYDYLGGRCVVCGVTENLEVDHIDPEQKSFNFTGNLTWNERLMSELDKCQLLCSEHHLRKTLAQREPFTHGTIYGFMKAKCKCVECSAKKRQWNDERNAERRAAGGNTRGLYGSPSNHGEILHYRRGCKCDLCRAANAAKARDYRARKKIETP